MEVKSPQMTSSAVGKSLRWPAPGGSRTPPAEAHRYQQGTQGLRDVARPEQQRPLPDGQGHTEQAILPDAVGLERSGAYALRQIAPQQTLRPQQSAAAAVLRSTSQPR